MNNPLVATLAVGVVTLSAGCPQVDTPEPDGCVAKERTCEEVLATFASGNDENVSVSCDEAAGTFTIEATGLPPWDPEELGESTPNVAAAQNWRAVLPLTPTCASVPGDVIGSRGEIGLAIDGIVLYGPEAAGGEDAYETESDTFDRCWGHADMNGNYHYHAEPPCVFGESTDTDSVLDDDGHAAVIAYLIDGFAIHASTTLSDEPALDGCNGHATDARGYHYHATDTTFPYLVGCYAGAQDGAITRR
jgi:hypothetical protein